MLTTAAADVLRELTEAESLRRDAAFKVIADALVVLCDIGLEALQAERFLDARKLVLAGWKTTLALGTSGGAYAALTVLLQSPEGDEQRELFGLEDQRVSGVIKPVTFN